MSEILSPAVREILEADLREYQSMATGIEGNFCVGCRANVGFGWGHRDPCRIYARIKALVALLYADPLLRQPDEAAGMWANRLLNYDDEANGKWGRLMDYFQQGALTPQERSDVLSIIRIRRGDEDADISGTWF